MLDLDFCTGRRISAGIQRELALIIFNIEVFLHENGGWVCV